MKRINSKSITRILNVITIALIVVSFLISFFIVQEYAERSCFERIEETTNQMSTMFGHAMDERLDKLTVFADILAANSENPEELLQVYMENFCRTQFFSAVCIHRANGTTTHYGEHPHNDFKLPSFEEEVARLPYVSELLFYSKKPKDNYIYQAVPIIRSGKTIAVLYGFTSLDHLPSFIASSAYDGQCQLYIVDGDSGNFIMDEYHGELNNIFDGSLGDREVKDGYDMEDMIKGVRNGESGFFVFKSQRTGLWYYTCFTPMGINNWSMQLTIDEPTAFADYNNINRTLLRLMLGVLVLMGIHLIALMYQHAVDRRKDRKRLQRTSFINSVQRALLNAHNNPNFVDRALHIVAEEMEAETAMLLSFTDNIITGAQYWPSKDKAQAQNLLGRNVRDDFPILYDVMSSGKSFVHDMKATGKEISDSAMSVFTNFDVDRLVLVPIMDTSGAMRATLSVVNSPEGKGPEILESVTYDFFMAITNLENHNIIKNMGAMDYLTSTKNRNSYESELVDYPTMDCRSLWCVFVDLNGLRELNNSRGHKAGDAMLCAVADALKRAFGTDFCYRMGGDEFIAFVKDGSEDILTRKKKTIAAELAAKGYSISMGFAGSEKDPDGFFDVEKMISAAEELMYKEKWQYYQEQNLPTETGHFPNLIK